MRKSLFLVVTFLILPGAWGLRIVSTSPQNTEWLYQLGQGDKIVATSSFSYYPEKATKLPTLGPLFMPSLGATLRHRPDLVVTDPFTTPLAYEQGLRTAGVRVESVVFPDLNSLFQRSKDFLTRYDQKSLSRLEPMQKCVDAIRNQPKKKFTFLAFTWTEPPILFGRKTLISNVVELIGGTNLAPESGNNPFPQLSEEWILKNRPEQIYFVSYSSETDGPFYRDFTRWWPEATPKSLPAKDFGRSTFSPILAMPRYMNSTRLLKECHAVEY